MDNKKILALGAVVADYTFIAEKLPNPDTKEKATKFISGIGGPAFTACAFTSKLGVETHFLGRVGSDLAGEAIACYCVENSIFINDDFVAEDKNITTNSASIWVEESTGSRTILWSQHNDIYNINFDHFDLSQFSLVILDGHNIDNAIKISKKCSALDIPVLVDAGSPKDNEEELIENTTFFIASKRYLDSKFPGLTPIEASTEILKKYDQIELAGFTIGENGFQGKCRDFEYDIKGEKVDEIVDTTGAGDIFHGAFAYNILKTGDIKESLEYANKMASQSCKFFGSVNSVENIAHNNLN